MIRWAAFIALSLVALAVRLPHLSDRPMHTDEAVNGWLTGQLLADKPFRYDPQDRHGPMLFVLAKPVARLCGAKNFSELTEVELRLTPVLVGSATILLFGAAMELFGFIPCLIGALFFAIGPLPVYYSRYFIHETLFVAATFAFMIYGWRTVEKKSRKLAPLAGLCAALMLGCKETALIHFFALGIAAFTAWMTFRQEAPERQLKTARASISMLLAAAGVFAVATVLLFTWFGRHWAALAELFRAIEYITARAGGQGHEKPFGYYFAILDPLFIFFITAAAGIYAVICHAVTGVRRAGFMLAIYGVLALLIYSFIPYKTPWLALNLWLPVVLLCGFGIEGIWLQFKNSAAKWGCLVAIAALCLVAADETKTLVFDHPADEKNPLAYAHTVDDILRLPPELSRLAASHHLSEPLIAVVAADPWPLPWYLRHFENVGFWQPRQDPGPADIYITSPDAADGIEARLKDRFPEFFGLRPEILIQVWPPPMQPTNHAP